jgi:predicted AlkP superfamily pyrophosphatase or phosphodiesterase
MRRTAVLNVVGLTPGLIGAATPEIKAFRDRGHAAVIDPALPAVTCTAQADYLTGRRPSDHGVVANGWHERAVTETWFWKQSDRLVGAPKLYETLKAELPGFTSAKLFWWYNLNAAADFCITPRPIYPADGRKVFDVDSWPRELAAEVKGRLGPFPFATFWGPAAGVPSPQGKPEAASAWIAASARIVEELRSPTLSLVYLPHLDYNLQRLGPAHPEVASDLGRIDAIVGGLIRFYADRGVRVILLSEYGITAVDQPVHLNRLFRKRGWLTVKDELGLELLDAGRSGAFAVADHQAAHIYVNDPALIPQVRSAVEAEPGVAAVWAAPELAANSLNHARSGDLIAFSKENAWFTYYYWLDDARAPDFARTVDIHRKPGYDPVELFIDPALRMPKLRIASRLLRKKLGFRMLMDVIPLDASLVRGSHGARPRSMDDWPVLIAEEPTPSPVVASTDICGFIARTVRGRD